MTIEQRKKLSIAHLEHSQTKETREKISKNHAKYWLGKKRPGYMKGKKHSEETRAKMSIAKIGKVSWAKGRKLTEETKRKIGLAGLGRPAWNKGLVGFRKGYKQSTEQKEKIRAANRGENNYNWNPDREAVRRNRRDNKNADYHLWARRVKLRDGWKCKIKDNECNGKLEAHHVLPWSKFPEVRYEINNGITLCQKHHPRSRDAEIRLAPMFQTMVLAIAH